MVKGPKRKQASGKIQRNLGKETKKQRKKNRVKKEDKEKREIIPPIGSAAEKPIFRIKLGRRENLMGAPFFFT